MAKSKVIPFSKIKKIDIINVKGGITANEVMKKYKPDIIVNLALYDVKTGTNITYLKDDGEKSGSYFSYDGIGIKNSKDMVWCTKDEAFADSTVRDYISGSPVIIKNGKPVKEWGNKYSSYVDGKHVRTCIGFNDKNLILVASDGATTLDNMANHCLSYSPKYMINCDGGGSTHLQYKNEVLARSTRANVSWLLVYLFPENGTLKTIYDVNVNFKGEVLSGAVIDGTTQLPVRKICEMLGLKVDFKNNEVYITQK